MSRTSVATASSSWIDDYIDWLSIESCCKIHETEQTFCPSNCMNSLSEKRSTKRIKYSNSIGIFVIAATDIDCISCPRNFVANVTTKRPTTETFGKYISFFLNDIPNSDCAKAGRPAYAPVILFFSSSKIQQHSTDADS